MIFHGLMVKLIGLLVVVPLLLSIISVSTAPKWSIMRNLEEGENGKENINNPTTYSNCDRLYFHL